ncbi:hypothetical protein HanXRQr2_Chr05g0208331 [Helianthus annuus]|uniref:Uncharacterized protein n=1 Tax=Helianthus annuus TaxID=4232 RepID=A0A9K3NM47_HELAN|nr:hypothetical protein HanXRQr2_Chr05g0208331 [Helianthus annuus]
MNGRCDTSGCTHIDAMAATLSTLSNGMFEFVMFGSMIDSSASLFVSSGRAHVTRFSWPGGCNRSTGFLPVRSSRRTTP